MSKLTETLANRNSRYIFFGGKGGVGKTVMAGARCMTCGLGK